jgi:hypothetical protein
MSARAPQVIGITGLRCAITGRVAQEARKRQLMTLTKKCSVA